MIILYLRTHAINRTFDIERDNIKLREFFILNCFTRSFNITAWNVSIINLRIVIGVL